MVPGMLNRRLFVAGLAAVAAPPAGRAAEPVKIVFVDTGNTGRSLMAETLGRAEAARRKLPVALISRALDPDPFDEAPEPNARALLDARGFDVAGHRARRLEPGDIAHADLILTMTDAHAGKVRAMAPEAGGKVFTLARYATGGDEQIPDAWGKPMAAYEAVIAQLDRLVPLALTKATAGRN